MAEHDYIVVGGGSAGCIVAARLAERGASVLLLEAGDRAEQHPETLSADGFVKAFSNDATMWDRLSDKQTACGGRHLYMGTGRGMGGSGAVNGMVYTRGDKADFAQWPAGWQWQDLEPAFEAVERTLRVRIRTASAFSDTCIESAAAVGFARKDVLNDGELDGYIGYQLMNYEGDRRRNSYVSFLGAQPPAGVTVRTGVLVERVLFDADKKAMGVVVRDASGLATLRVRKEVILCAGALETPKLLMLSGVGPRDVLSPLQIPVVHESPFVGKHLQDHPNVCMFLRGKHIPDSFYPQVYGFKRINPALPLAGGAPDTCFVFYSAHASLKESVQRMLPTILLPPMLYKYPALKALISRLAGLAFGVPWLQQFVAKLYGIVVILGKPQSRGQVSLHSSDPQVAPAVDPGYFSHPADMQTMISALHKAADMARAPGFARWGNTGLSAPARTRDPDRIATWVKGAAMTTFHFCGSVRMGDDAESPVDLHLRVKGVSGLRVVDASVMPVIPVSALNAPTMAIAWKAADLIPA